MISPRMRPRSSLILASAVLAALAPVAAMTRADAAPTRRCPTADLDVWLKVETGGGAAGSFYYKLEFTNLSPSACTLSGYPGVSAVDLHGHQIGAPARRERFHAPRTVRLASDASAVAVLRVTDAGNYRAASCHGTLAAGVRVYPPGETRSRIVPFPFSACSQTTVHILAVRSLEPGAVAASIAGTLAQRAN